MLKPKCDESFMILIQKLGEKMKSRAKAFLKQFRQTKIKYRCHAIDPIVACHAIDPISISVRCKAENRKFAGKAQT